MPAVAAPVSSRPGRPGGPGRTYCPLPPLVCGTGAVGAPASPPGFGLASLAGVRVDPGAVPGTCDAFSQRAKATPSRIRMRPTGNSQRAMARQREREALVPAAGRAAEAVPAHSSHVVLYEIEPTALTWPPALWRYHRLPRQDAQYRSQARLLRQQRGSGCSCPSSLRSLFDLRSLPSLGCSCCRLRYRRQEAAGRKLCRLEQ